MKKPPLRWNVVRAVGNRRLYMSIGTDRAVPSPSSEGFYWRMVPDTLWRHPDLKPMDTHVWCALLLYARDRGECQATNKSLAETVGCSLATIKTSLSRLEDAGFIVGESRGPHRTIKIRPEGGTDTPSPYKLKAFAG
jgi:biotin operon repressor